MSDEVTTVVRDQEWFSDLLEGHPVNLGKDAQVVGIWILDPPRFDGLERPGAEPPLRCDLDLHLT